MFNAVRNHAKDGVDFVTLHAGMRDPEAVHYAEAWMDYELESSTFLIKSTGPM